MGYIIVVTYCMTVLLQIQWVLTMCYLCIVFLIKSAIVLESSTTTGWATIVAYPRLHNYSREEFIHDKGLKVYSEQMGRTNRTAENFRRRNFSRISRIDCDSWKYSPWTFCSYSPILYTTYIEGNVTNMITAGGKLVLPPWTSLVLMLSLPRLLAHIDQLPQYLSSCWGHYGRNCDRWRCAAILSEMIWYYSSRMVHYQQ